MYNINMSNNRFSCLKPSSNGDIPNNNSSESGNKFKRPQQNNRWDRNNTKKNSRFPSPERTSRFSSNKRNSRFPSPERNSRFPSPERNSRFPSPERNSRFPSPERNSRFENQDNKFNSFTQPKRDDKPRHSRGGFGKFAYNHGRRSTGPSVFDNVKKDRHGRPMLHNATTSAFDIGNVLKKVENPKKTKNKKKKKNQVNSFFEEEEKKTDAELKAEREWNKQMILNMQYATDSEDETLEDEILEEKNQEEL